MSKQPIITANEDESILLNAGLVLVRSKGSHPIYMKDKIRIVIPFHSGKTLHPKIAKQVYTAIEAQ